MSAMTRKGGHKPVDSTALHQEGRRMTLQRRVILDVLEAERAHLAAEDIYERVYARFPQISRATVYRTLDTLEQLALVSHTHAGPSGALYHLSDKPAHLHLLCNSCGQVVETAGATAADELGAELFQRYGFVADPSHFVIGGLCRNCAGAVHATTAARHQHH